jgi:light-regulated signal transduction histidine kinase (bacteriophytochrome)
LTLYSQAVDAFDGKEVSLLEDLATDLAFGIHTARVRKERKQAEEEIRRLNQDLERRVRERTAELEATNSELEAFTYSVSHDLRAPLRHIDGFSRLLQEEYSSKLDDTAQHYLERIRTGTLNMGRLVDDLLSLSRIGRRELTCELTGLGSLLREVVHECEAETLGRRMEWKVGELPFVECDPALMKLVFQNLLSNACKFTRPREVATIEVGQTVVDGQPAVFVRDNGVGFSMRHVDKLFGVFQRLHRQADFEGTGVGLATVQRIIHKHGGRIWAEGEVNKGATFFFTLPAMRAREEARNAA